MRRSRAFIFDAFALPPRIAPSGFAHVAPAPKPVDPEILPPIEFGGSDEGSAYPGDFPAFVPIYAVEVGPAGCAF